jgi:AcrR family transcriptional regulator
MILDQTADLISVEGTSQLSMDFIGQKVGVSKAMMYRYFDSLNDLLRTLLKRELNTLMKQQFDASEKAETFEELVRNITRVYLKYIERRGLVIERLQTYPNISDMQDPTDYQREASVKYLADIIAKSFNMPQAEARAITDISFGLPASAGDYLLRSNMDRQRVEDITVAMIIGSVSGVQYDISVRSQKLKR